jgi:hypothetical protein
MTSLHGAILKLFSTRKVVKPAGDSSNIVLSSLKEMEGGFE